MVVLQQQMKHGDRDSQGLAMLEYAIGMRNSFNRCWYLTTYGYSWWGRTNRSWEFIKEDQSSENPITRLSAWAYPFQQKYSRRADQLQKQALRTIQSDEAKAKAYARLCMFKRMMKECRNTATAQRYAIACDQWKQYRLASK